MKKFRKIEFLNTNLTDTFSNELRPLFKRIFKITKNDLSEEYSQEVSKHVNFLKSNIQPYKKDDKYYERTTLLNTNSSDSFYLGDTFQIFLDELFNNISKRTNKNYKYMRCCDFADDVLREYMKSLNKENRLAFISNLSKNKDVKFSAKDFFAEDLFVLSNFTKIKLIWFAIIDQLAQEEKDKNQDKEQETNNNSKLIR